MNYFKRYTPLQLIWFATSEAYARIWKWGILRSYSQFDEDRTLDALTGHKKHGFYVDVGAFDPYRFSNTMRFYMRGWRGINIEPNPMAWARFQIKRSRDINLNLGIALKKRKLTYFQFDPTTLSTFEPLQAGAYKKKGFTLVGKVKVQVIPIKDVFRIYAQGREIDFMSVDVEGMEDEVLRSNDWLRFRPHVICVESADYSDTREGKQAYGRIRTILTNYGYRKVAQNGLNSFYEDSRYKK